MFCIVQKKKEERDKGIKKLIRVINRYRYIAYWKIVVPVCSS